ncbi:hypothetical protein ABIC03_001958 [Bradyrhizobium sp. RT6a]|uniref:hypothetical protein n=1 Tax=Bradyrhizobium sp. RT6a TaxID=3156381 RepID=UPI0033983394
MIMANQNQIEANRRNATKSTGPRSRGGKTRVSQNAWRHGLSTPFQANAAQTKIIEKLAKQIAGPLQGRIAFELARAAAIAAFDLARVRQAKAQIIKSAPGFVEPPPTVTGSIEEARDLKLALRRKASPPRPTPGDPWSTMSCDEAEPPSEAVRRALPQLARLDRYEARAVARRDRAIRAIIKLGC